MFLVVSDGVPLAAFSISPATIPAGCEVVAAPTGMDAADLHNWRLGGDGGWFFNDAPYVASAGAVAAAFVQKKADAVTQVNTLAGQERAKYITVTIAQDSTYLDKAAEAKAYLAAKAASTAITAGTYPYIEAEASATGMTEDAVAELISSMETTWRTINAKIEGIRRGACVAIDAATTAEAIDAILAGLMFE